MTEHFLPECKHTFKAGTFTTETTPTLPECMFCKVERLEQEIEELKKLITIKDRGLKLTLLARYTGNEFADADILLSDDDLNKALASLATLKERDPTIRAAGKAEGR
jgi:hypothetical protein